MPACFFAHLTKLHPMHSSFVPFIVRQVSKAVDGITYVPDYEETQVTEKGTKWFEDGECFRE